MWVGRVDIWMISGRFLLLGSLNQRLP